jgi:Protein of unknown function (DUF3313)
MNAGLRSFLLAAVALACCSGCAATTPDQDPQAAGFLVDYRGFEQVEDSHALVYAAPGLDLSGYQALVLEPIGVWPEDASQQDARRGFARRLEDAVRAALGKRFRLVDDPQPGALRVRAAITEADSGAIVTQQSFFRGRASVEVEVVDARSGERLLAGVARRLGGKSAWINEASEEDAQAVADLWAEGIAERLQAAGLPLAAR